MAGAPSRQLTRPASCLYTPGSHSWMFSWHTSELEPDALEAQLSAHNAKHLEIALAIVADLLSSCALGLALGSSNPDCAASLADYAAELECFFEGLPELETAPELEMAAKRPKPAAPPAPAAEEQAPQVPYGGAITASLPLHTWLRMILSDDTGPSTQLDSPPDQYEGRGKNKVHRSRALTLLVHACLLAPQKNSIKQLDKDARDDKIVNVIADKFRFTICVMNANTASPGAVVTRAARYVEGAGSSSADATTPVTGKKAKRSRRSAAADNDQ